MPTRHLINPNGLHLKQAAEQNNSLPGNHTTNDDIEILPYLEEKLDCSCIGLLQSSLSKGTSARPVALTS
jgi:hypothetical protein